MHKVLLGFASKEWSVISWPDHCGAAADINDYTIEQTAIDLCKCGLGSGKLGDPTTDQPAFPLSGMCWWYRMQPFFEMIGALASLLSADSHCAMLLQLEDA